MPIFASALAGPLLLISTAGGITLHDRFIRVRDIAQSSAWDDVVVGRIPANSSHVSIDEETARQLLRNRVPAASFVLRFNTEVQLSAPPAQAHSGVCFETSVSVRAKQIIYRDAVRPVGCTQERASNVVRYDAMTKAPVANGPLVAGSYLGRINPATERRVAKGEVLTLVTGGSGVRIARQVEAMQAGRANHSVFVKTSDGDVFAAPFSYLESEGSE